jgi:hypothetical protein
LYNTLPPAENLNLFAAALLVFIFSFAT